MMDDQSSPLVSSCGSRKEQPMQPIEVDPDGILRFKANKIVRFLLDAGPFDMNAIARMEFSKRDREQFAQLIGYSVSGFGDLSYVRRKTVNKADKLAAKL